MKIPESVYCNSISSSGQSYAVPIWKDPENAKEGRCRGGNKTSDSKMDNAKPINTVRAIYKGETEKVSQR